MQRHSAVLAWDARDVPEVAHGVAVAAMAGPDEAPRRVVDDDDEVAMPFVKLAKTVRAHRDRIEAAFDTDASNGLAESTNTRVRLLHRVAFGFHSAEPLGALAMLKLGGFAAEVAHRASKRRIPQADLEDPTPNPLGTLRVAPATPPPPCRVALRGRPLAAPLGLAPCSARTGAHRRPLRSREVPQCLLVQRARAHPQRNVNAS